VVREAGLLGKPEGLRKDLYIKAGLFCSHEYIALYRITQRKRELVD